MNVYAIRHKPTGHWLPGRRRRGYSHDEPELNGGKYGPRFFFSLPSARAALTAWLRGTFKQEHSGGHSLFGEDSDYDEWLEVTPQPHRKREDMEIVKFKLAEESNG